MNSKIPCPVCGQTNPPDTLYCLKCNAPLPGVDEMATLGGKPVREVSRTDPGLPTFGGGGVTPPPLMERGTKLANGRYEILAILGQGAMGAVYKAKDHELDRWVAIKVIQPELSSSSTMLKRFKQELIMARQVTHRNVIRIFDIGETDGMKFITMEYIDGGDLKSVIIERGKIPPEEAVGIVRQICHALDAAHTEGVVHRDLKPQNIMIDQNDRVVVMDFGIAQSKELPGMTMTGALMGTPEYMSPEQAKGDKTDMRADIFAVGIIFYEMLIGKVPFKAKTVVETMYKRTQERAVPPVDLDSSVPVQANRIVMKCLETDPANRYQSAKELLQDLEAFDPQQKISALDRARRGVKRRSKTVATIAAVASVALLAVLAGFLLRGRIGSTPPAAQAPITVLVADFSNETGDAVFSGTLESMSTTAMEEASFVNTYRRDQARALLGRLENGATNLDESAARKIAIREGISVIIAGSIVREGTGYKIAVRAVDAVTGNMIATKEVNAPSNEVVLRSVGRLIAPIRTALGDATPESAQLAAAETYTTSSLEAAHAYALGQESQTKPAEAIKNYLQAVDLDPNLGRAYAGLALIHVNLKNQKEAGEYYKKALSLTDRMSEREKYRTLGTYYLTYAGNYEEGIDALRKLVLLYPADGAAHNNLSGGYVRVGKMPESLAASRRALEISPRNIQRRYNYALHAMYAGDLPTAITEADKVLEQNPNYELAYQPLALSAILRGDPTKALEIYDRLEKVSRRGASLSTMGRADLNMYSGQYAAAAKTLLSGVAIDEKDGNSGELAHKLIALAEGYLAIGRTADAVAAAEKAARATDLDGMRFLAARVLVEAGEDAKAQRISTDLDARLQKQTKALALLIAGDMSLKRNRFGDAVESYRAAQELHDSWLSHLLFGKAYVEAGHFPEALAQLEAADKRSGEATDLFDNDTTSLRYLPPLYYWLGRAQEGLGTRDAARKSYERFIKIREQADATDKLLADAKRRIGS